MLPGFIVQEGCAPPGAELPVSPVRLDWKGGLALEWWQEHAMGAEDRAWDGERDKEHHLHKDATELGSESPNRQNQSQKPAQP